MALLCGPPLGRSEADVLRMTRAYVLNVLFCPRGRDGEPVVSAWQWERG